MKRIYLFLGSVFIFSTVAFSQAYEGNIEYNKKKQQAIQIDYSYSQEAVENAIVQKIEKMGYKAKEEKGLFNKDKGFIVFKNAFITDISENSMDYIIKVDRKSRKEKDETTLYLIMSKDDVNAISAMDATGVGKAKSFLNNLLPEIEEANLELQIKSQDETVAKAEKKYKNLQDDQQSLEKKIKGLQSDLEKNIKDQENQQKEIENQKQASELLKGKRKVSQ
ncbi:MAG: hypothetical protein ABI675_09080 [Chitinophagaceae bacterium]